MELDDDEYEIEIEAKGKEYDIEIDAYTGKVLNFEVEDDRDDDDHHQLQECICFKIKTAVIKDQKRISADGLRPLLLR